MDGDFLQMLLMKNAFRQFFGHWTLFQRFTLVSFGIMLAGMAVIGWWVSERIKAEVVHETAVTTALYMNSFIAPNIQELSSSDSLSPEHIATLDKLLNGTDLGNQIVAFKVWDGKGRILFSDNPALIGQVFPSEQEQEQAIAFSGKVVSGISNLDEAEHVEERRFYGRLLQIYSPIRQDDTNRIIAVAEFYQTIDALEADIAKAQQQSWLIVGLSMGAIYFLLIGFVRWTEKTILRQEATLAKQVTKLTELLAHNAELNQRVKQAAANATEVNERFLRRTSAELHDGPIQELGLAMLRLDQVIAHSHQPGHSQDPESDWVTPLSEIQKSLERSLQEIRNISKGLGLPQLEKMSLPEVLLRAVKSHERRTGTQVLLEHFDLPDQANLPVKITIFRFVQEALNNAFQHADGQGQKVLVKNENGLLQIAVADEGPGFDPNQPIDWDEHLGLAGMRERIESLGGEFQIKSEIKRGTTVLARLHLQATDSEH